MNENKQSIKPVWVDPDDAPEQTAADFARADVYAGERLVRRGRPVSTSPLKSATTIRFDADVLSALKASGPGWQTRVNAIVRAAVLAKNR